MLNLQEQGLAKIIQPGHKKGMPNMTIGAGIEKEIISELNHLISIYKSIHFVTKITKS